ncbi:MAG: WYL domain-containing protein [Acidobacteria bacterium]|nr:WYL domain-containing protein [Acidobacteriota bacterium]
MVPHHLGSYAQSTEDFLVSRIRELTITEEQFSWPDQGTLEEHLKTGFGGFRGNQEYEVEILFDEYQARWIRERSKFHPSEDREEQPDGSLILKMKVSALDGIKRFVMQYGGHAKVLKPEELKIAILEEANLMITIYQ